MVSGRIKINGFRAGLQQDSSISTGLFKVDRPADVNEREAFCARAVPHLNSFNYLL